jgi:hypothetical protein
MHICFSCYLGERDLTQNSNHGYQHQLCQITTMMSILILLKFGIKLTKCQYKVKKIFFTNAFTKVKLITSMATKIQYQTKLNWIVKVW